MNDARLQRLLLSCTLLVAAPTAGATPPDPLCAPLRASVDSVGPEQTHTITFRTIWGSDFKDTHQDRIFMTKRCDSADYDPARPLCTALLNEGATEFARNNVNRVITCLVPKTHFSRTSRSTAATSPSPPAPTTAATRSTSSSATTRSSAAMC